MGCPIRSLRHIEIAVRDTGLAGDRLSEVLGIGTAWDYSNDALHMRALRAGHTFLELVHPVNELAPPARFIESRGEGTYFLVLQSAMERDSYALDLLHRRVLLSGLWEDEQYRLIWIHPKAVRGVHLELGEVVHPENPWTGGDGPGRDTWYRRPATGDVRQVRHGVVVVRSLERGEAKWRSLFDMAPVWRDDGPTTRSSVLPFGDGDTFIEIREPVDPLCDEAQFLAERGEGLFSTVLEGDLDAIEPRVRAVGGYRPLTARYPDVDGFVIDPTTTHGVRIECVRAVGETWPFGAGSLLVEAATGVTSALR